MEFIAIPTKNSVVAAIKIVGMRLDTDFDRDRLPLSYIVR